MTQAVEIVNHALDLVGANAITALNDPVREAQVASRVLPIARRAFLRDNLYNFAKRYATLTALSPTPDPNPIPDFEYIFDLPADCIKAWAVKRPDSLTGATFPNPSSAGLQYLDRWKVVGRQLGAPLDSITLEYGVDEPGTGEDYTNWDTASIDALAALLAYKLTIALSQSVTMQDRMFREAQRTRQVAQNRNGQEGVKDKFRTEGRLVGARQSRASVWRGW